MKLAAAAAPAGQHDAAADAGEDAAQQAGGQVIIHNGGGWDGDDAVKQGVGHGADDGLCHQAQAQGFVGEQQDGDVYQEVQDTGDVVSAEGHTQQRLQKGTDELAHAHDAAGVKVQRDDEQVQRGGGDQLAHHGGDDPQPAVVQSIIKHRGTSRL